MFQSLVNILVSSLDHYLYCDFFTACRKILLQKCPETKHYINKIKLELEDKKVQIAKEKRRAKNIAKKTGAAVSPHSSKKKGSVWLIRDVQSASNKLWNGYLEASDIKLNCLYLSMSCFLCGITCCCLGKGLVGSTIQLGSAHISILCFWLLLSTKYHTH